MHIELYILPHKTLIVIQLKLLYSVASNVQIKYIQNRYYLTIFLCHKIIYIYICIILSCKQDQQNSEFQTLAIYIGRIKTQ